MRILKAGALALLFLAQPLSAGAQTVSPELLKHVPKVPPPTFTLIAGFRGGTTPLPKKYVAKECGGQNISPALRWVKTPRGTKSLLLTVTDQQEGGAFHWILSDIKPAVTSLPLGAGARDAAYGRPTKNSFAKTGYFGPCPPEKSTHTYLFALYALDVVLPPIEGPQYVDQLVANHIIMQTTVFVVSKR
jgi:Raf kinase inhibitor-like YbhB/YbcL family protein